MVRSLAVPKIAMMTAVIHGAPSTCTKNGALKATLRAFSGPKTSQRPEVNISPPPHKIPTTFTLQELTHNPSRETCMSLIGESFP